MPVIPLCPWGVLCRVQCPLRCCSPVPARSTARAGDRKGDTEPQPCGSQHRRPVAASWCSWARQEGTKQAARRCGLQQGREERRRAELCLCLRWSPRSLPHPRGSLWEALQS